MDGKMSPVGPNRRFWSLLDLPVLEPRQDEEIAKNDV
jgi:hypothetical protein